MYKDLTINAYPTHSGNTSLEIQIDCWQEGEYMLTALFLFVAREKTNPALSKAIPNLSFEGEQDVQGCELRRAIGEHNKIERKYQRDNTLLLNPPSDSEILEIH
jgi:acyl-CoA hydrolase